MHRPFQLAILLAGSCFILPVSVATAQAKWEAVASADGSLPVARHEAAYVCAGDKCYLAGGRRINPVSIFDPATSTWTQGAMSPIELHHFQPCVYEGKILFAGALTGPYPGETPVPHLYTYDPETDAWTQGAEIPEDRRRGATGNVIYKGKLYMACGIKDGHRGDHKKWFDSYDLESGAWEQLPDAPRARDHFQAAVVDDRLYLIGGRRSTAPDNVFGNTIAEIDVFDFATGTWSTLDAPIPTLRAGLFLCVVDHEILAFGGETAEQQQAHDEVEALDTRTGTWRTLPPMLRGRHGTGAARIGQNIYVASGCGNRGGNPELTSQEVLRLE